MLQSFLRVWGIATHHRRTIESAEVLWRKRGIAEHAQFPRHTVDHFYADLMLSACLLE